MDSFCTRKKPEITRANKKIQSAHAVLGTADREGSHQPPHQKGDHRHMEKIYRMANKATHTRKNGPLELLKVERIIYLAPLLAKRHGLLGIYFP